MHIRVDQGILKIKLEYSSCIHASASHGKDDSELETVKDGKNLRDTRFEVLKGIMKSDVFWNVTIFTRLQGVTPSWLD
jgi:hypothetical protein